jgi:steroid 5-alpha reductase family enzyme
MKELKENRVASFIVIAFVYIMAIIAGVITYRALNFSWWVSLLIADVVSTTLTFIFSLIFKNASVYDPYWSVQPLVILIAFACGKNITSYGLLLLVVVSIWAIRLTANWAYTFKNLTCQDWRYTMLNETTGKFYPLINFIGIHMVPTVIVYACTLPGVYALREGISANVLSVVFLCLSLAAIIIQGTSDIQMHKFRKHKDSTFIHTGLWKYSRHPNYLGEILMWWGIGLSVVSASYGNYYLLIGAILNTILFLTVSIPMADKRQSHKQGFEEYKKQTRMLLPIKK